MCSFHCLFIVKNLRTKIEEGNCVEFELQLLQLQLKQPFTATAFTFTHRFESRLKLTPE
jgi:hypothetical protein